jgi:hypothetical protein
MIACAYHPSLYLYYYYQSVARFTSPLRPATSMWPCSAMYSSMQVSCVTQKAATPHDDTKNVRGPTPRYF